MIIYFFSGSSSQVETVEKMQSLLFKVVVLIKYYRRLSILIITSLRALIFTRLCLAIQSLVLSLRSRNNNKILQPSNGRLRKIGSKPKTTFTILRSLYEHYLTSNLVTISEIINSYSESLKKMIDDSHQGEVMKELVIRSLQGVFLLMRKTRFKNCLVIKRARIQNEKSVFLFLNICIYLLFVFLSEEKK